MNGTSTLHGPGKHFICRCGLIEFDGSLAAKLPEFDSRVLLTGEGGDEWLVGSFAHFPDLLRQGRLIQLAREGLIP